MAIHCGHRTGLEDALNQDEFDDATQYSTLEAPHLPEPLGDLITAFLPREGDCVEVGPGSTPYVEEGRGSRWARSEPSKARADHLKESGFTCDQAFAEALPYQDRRLACILMLNGFFQVRSDYEAIIEFNRVLKHGGRLLFNVHTSDRTDIIVGRIYGSHNLARMVNQFGFRTLCLWEGEVKWDRYGGVPDIQAFLAFEKVRNAEYTDINMPQLIPRPELAAGTKDRIFQGVNIDLEGRERHLA